MNCNGIAGFSPHDSAAKGGLPADFPGRRVGFVFPDYLPGLDASVFVFQFDPGSKEDPIASLTRWIDYFCGIQAPFQESHALVDLAQAFFAVDILSIFRAIAL